jgi:hypothetical protein
VIAVPLALAVERDEEQVRGLRRTAVRRACSGSRCAAGTTEDQRMRSPRPRRSGNRRRSCRRRRTRRSGRSCRCDHAERELRGRALQANLPYVSAAARCRVRKDRGPAHRSGRHSFPRRQSEVDLRVAPQAGRAPAACPEAAADPRALRARAGTRPVCGRRDRRSPRGSRRS